MSQRTPSSRKGKEKVRNRALRSSASPESEDKGQDAPLEPICDFFSEPSLPQAEDKDPGLTVAPVEVETPQEAEPFVAVADKSSKAKKRAARRNNKKHKTEGPSQGKGKPSNVPTSSVTRQHTKIPKSDGGESPLIESMAASSLVELSTSGKKSVPPSLSRQPLASNAPLGRVTHSKAKARGLAPSPLAGTPNVAFVDLGTDDAMTPPAQVAPITVPPTPTVTPADEATATSHDVHSAIPAHKVAITTPDDHSTPPESRGKTKL